VETSHTLICQRKGCDRPALWHPILSLRVHLDHPLALAKIPLALCDDHKRSTKVEDLLCDEGWAAISTEFASRGHALPHRELTTLAWEMIS